MSGASDCHRGLKGVISRFRSVQDSLPAEDMVAQSEAPAPRYGSADAYVYAFAKRVIGEVGPDEASRLADRYVAFTQQLIRTWPHET